MHAIGKFIFAATYILGLLNVIIFVGAVVELLKGSVGFLAYILWVIVAPIMSPAILALPWFDAWVSDRPVNDIVFVLWLSFVICVVLRIVTWKYAPDKE